MPAAAAIVGAALSVGATVAAVAGASTLLVVGLALAGKALTMYSQMAALEEKQKGVKRTVTSTQAALPVVYGKQRIAGKLIDARVDGSSPSDKVMGWVVALCVGSRDGSGIEGLVEAYFDDKLAIDPDATVIVKKPWSYTMSANSSSGFGSHIGNHINHKFYTGSYSQTVDSDLNTVFPNAWPSTSELRGIAYSRFFLVFNKDKVFPNGSIPNMEFVVKGNRVEDPRDDTWKYSTNPALCIRDFMLSDGYGLALDSSDLDEDSFIAEANFCDETVDDGDGGTEKRFTCNGLVDTGRSIRRNLEELLSSCRGQIIYQGGKYRLHIPKSKTAVNFHLQDKHIVGDYSWRRAGQEETANSVTATFVSAADDWSTDDVTFPEPGSTNDALTEDGGFENNTEIQLPFVDHEAQARRIAMVVMKESREDVTISATGTEEVLQLEVGDVIKHSHNNPNWDEKKFWVSSMSLNASGGVALGLTEYSDAAYDIDSYSTSTPPPDPSQKDPTTVVQPSNVSATSGSGTAISTGEGSNLPRMLVTWTAADDPFLEQTEVRYKEVTDPDGNSTAGKWQRTPVVDEKDDQQIYISQVKDGAEYKVQVRSVTTSNFTSDWVEINHTVSGDAQHRPIIQTESSESGDTGTVTATVIDPAGSGLIDVDWYVRTGQEAYPGTPTQTDTGISSGNSASISVTLDSERNTYVRAVAELQVNGKTAIEEVTLDSDDIAQIEHLSASVDEDTGEVFVSAEGQSDTSNIYIKVGKGSSPSDPTGTDNDASISGRDGTVATGVNLSHNQRGYVKAVAANSDGDLGQVVQTTVTRTVAGQPMILVDTSESSTDGTLDAEVHDPDGGTLTVRFYQRQGLNSSYGSATTTHSNLNSGSTVSSTITLIEDKNSWIKVEAEVEATGEKNSKEVAFDPNKTANIANLSAFIDDNGLVNVRASGDSDTSSIDLVLSSPVDETHTINSRSGAYTSTASVPPGDTVTVTATPKNSDGTAGSDEVVEASRDGSGTSEIAPSPVITRISENSNGILNVDLVYEIDGNAGAASDSPSLEAKHRVNGPGDSMGTYSSFSSTPYQVTVSLDVREAKELEVIVRDTALSGNPESAATTRTVPSLLEFIGDNGLPDTNFPTSGGDFPGGGRSRGAQNQNHSGSGYRPNGRGVEGGAFAAFADGLRPKSGVGNLIGGDGKVQPDLAYQSGDSVDTLEPAEAAAEVTQNKDLSVLSGVTADKMTYVAGDTVESKEPAQAGADVTNQNTANDTDNVNGTLAADVDDGAARARSAIKSSGTSLASGVTGPNNEGDVRDIKRDDGASEGSTAYSPGTIVVAVT